MHAYVTMLKQNLEMYEYVHSTMGADFSKKQSFLKEFSGASACLQAKKESLVSKLFCKTFKKCLKLSQFVYVRIRSTEKSNFRNITMPV